MGQKKSVSQRASRDRKIKLVQIIAESGTTSGGPRHILGIFTNIDKNKFDLFLVCPTGELAKIADKISGVKVITHKMSAKYSILTIFCLKKILQKIQAESDPFAKMIVHTHGPRAGFLGRSALSAGMISVYTEHIWVEGYFLENRLNEIIQKKMLKWLNFKTNLIIAVSSAVKKYLVNEKLALENRIAVIHNGIKIANRKSQNAKPDHQIIGTVGGLNKMKGQIYLVRAMPKIIEKFPHATLEIVGEGAERESLEREIRQLNMERHITLLGQKNCVGDIMRRWSVFVLPSVSETFGITILEAWAMDLPVVASNVGGITDIIQNNKNGLLVVSKDPTALAKSIIKILEHPAESAKLVRGGRERVRQFEWKKVIKEVEGAYINLITKKQDTRNKQ